jgi:hypothetical protein
MHAPVARCRGRDNRQFQRSSSLRQGHHVVFQLAGRIVADTSYEADLMIDENERGVFGSQGARRGGFD